MSIESNNLMNLADGKVLYDDLRGRIESAGGGTDDYSDLSNKPQINGVTLAGNKTASDLGLLSGQSVTEAVDDYLEENFSNPSNPPLDRTLTSGLSAAPADIVGDLKNEIDDLPTDETAQELLTYEEMNAGLTDTALAVIGLTFQNLPQDDTATDILNSLSLECERLQAIYDNWLSERSA